MSPIIVLKTKTEGKQTCKRTSARRNIEMYKGLLKLFPVPRFRICGKKSNTSCVFMLWCLIKPRNDCTLPLTVDIVTDETAWGTSSNRTLIQIIWTSGAEDIYRNGSVNLTAIISPTSCQFCFSITQQNIVHSAAHAKYINIPNRIAVFPASKQINTHTQFNISWNHTLHP